MTPPLPRTVRAVDTAQLLDLAQEAAMHGLSQRLPVDRLQEHLAAEATRMVSRGEEASVFPGGSPQYRPEDSASRVRGRAGWADPFIAGGMVVGRRGLGLAEIPLSCGGSYFGHRGELLGYTTWGGATRDGTRTAVVYVSSDGGQDTGKAMTTLVEQELCRTRPWHSSRS